MDQESSLAVGDAISRLRLLERRQESLREKLLVINNNMVEEYKKLLYEVRSLVADIREIKSNLSTMQENVKLIIKDSESFARKEQLKVLEKYINLWSPLNFVTEEQLNNRLKKHHKKHSRHIKPVHRIKRKVTHGRRKKVSKRKHR